MFGSTRTISELGSELRDRESRIAVLRAEQAVLVQQLEVAQATQADGSRSMVDWVQAHLDVHRDLARRLVFASRRLGWHRGIAHRLGNGACTFDRAVAAVRLADTGASDSEIDESFDRDLAGVARTTARRRRMTSHDEHRAFNDRYFVVQPNLDESLYRLWGQLPGVMGRTVEKTIGDRADELRTIADVTGIASSRGQRQADALVAIVQDSSDRNIENGSSDGSPQVSVFVDATVDDAVETSAEIAFGPRVGPATLEQLLCGGTVQVIGLDAGRPVVASHATRAIPPAIRATVIHRDGGCTIDGCVSRYRLEPHHITRWSDGGSHDVDNLTTLCWYHHHVAIHGSGYRIDPESPSHRRRLIRGNLCSGPDPPT